MVKGGVEAEKRHETFEIELSRTLPTQIDPLLNEQIDLSESFNYNA